MLLPEKLQLILRRIDQGIDRHAIASEENIQVNSLDHRFRRCGYYWMPELSIYCRKTPSGYLLVDDNHLPQRAMEVIIQCRSVKADKLQVAYRLGFGTVRQMEEYMSSYNLYWDEQEHRYMVKRKNEIVQ